MEQPAPCPAAFALLGAHAWERHDKMRQDSHFPLEWWKLFCYNVR